jgi:hypothetical protein
LQPHCLVVVLKLERLGVDNINTELVLFRGDGFKKRYPGEYEAKMSEPIDTDIINVVKTESAVPRNDSINPDEKRKREEREHKQRDEARDHFEELSRIAELANIDLQKEGSPFRFNVYREGEEVFVDLVILDQDGGIKEIIEKNITHQEFSDWISRIERGEGFLIDRMG